MVRENGGGEGVFGLGIGEMVDEAVEVRAVEEVVVVVGGRGEVRRENGEGGGEVRVRVEKRGVHLFEEVAVAVRAEERGGGGGGEERDAHVALVTPVRLPFDGGDGGGGGG